MLLITSHKDQLSSYKLTINMDSEALSMLSILIALKNENDDTCTRFCESASNIKDMTTERAEKFYNAYGKRTVDDLKALESQLLVAAIGSASVRTSVIDTKDAEYLSPSQRNLLGLNIALTKLESSYTNYTNSGIRIMVNGVLLNSPGNIKNAFNRARPQDDLARSHLDIQPVERSAITPNQAFPLVNLKDVLNKKTEQEAQQIIRRNAVSMHATDTSGAANESTVTLPQRMVFAGAGGANTVVDNIYNLSARPDLTANFGHLYMDVKVSSPEGDLSVNDFAVLSQAGDRVYAERNAYAVIKRSITFAATSRKAWAVVYVRGPGKQETIHFNCINHDVVSFMWMQIFLRVAEIGFNYWIHEEGTLLAASLSYMGLDYKHCFTRLTAQSTSNVYTVCTPRNYYYPTGMSKSTVGVSGSTVHFCVKVHNNVESFDRESAALKSIAPTHIRGGVNFYATGALRNDKPRTYSPFVVSKDGIVTLALSATKMATRHSIQLFGPSFKTPMDFWTDDITRPRSKLKHLQQDQQRRYDIHPGGTIFMLPGKKPDYSSHDARAQWLRGVQHSLRLTHQAGYLHCDLRLANILEFDDNTQIIDYDLASKVGDCTVAFKKGGAQWRGAGKRVADILDAAPHTEQVVLVPYTAADDHEMLEKTMLSILSQAEQSRQKSGGSAGGSASGSASGSGAGGPSGSATNATAHSSGDSSPANPGGRAVSNLSAAYVKQILDAVAVEKETVPAPRQASGTMHAYLKPSGSVGEDISAERASKRKKT